MHERRKEDPGSQYALSGEEYLDWDNPEDLDEGEPEGYYDPEEEEDDDSYVPGPDDPDYDLSEEAGYAGWEAPAHRGPVPQWAIAAFCIVLLLAMVGGYLIRFG